MADPQDRLKKMVDFIKGQGQQKADQILDNANQQFKIEKNKLISQQKERIQDEFRKELEKAVIQKRIQRSSLINQSRLAKMQKRFDEISTLKDDVRIKLETLIQDEAIYRELLKKLIIQGMIKLLEARVELKVLQRDLPLAKSVLNACEEEFSAIVKKETGKEFKCTLSVNDHHYLTDIKGKKILGGVVLNCNNGRIVCANTLDDRLDLSFQEFLPDIRNGLFVKK